MTRVACSFLAVLLLAVSQAAPAFANGTAQGRSGSITLSGLPDIVSPGDVITANFSITLNPDAVKQKDVVFRLMIDSPLGNSTLRRGVVTMRPGVTKSRRFTFTVPERAPTGKFTLVAAVHLDGEDLVVDHTFLVRDVR